MAQPTPYNRSYDFESYQLANPAEPLPGDQVNAELDAAEITLNGICTNLALIQADDGGLLAGLVDYDALDSDVKLLLADLSTWTLRGGWVTATAYAVGDVVHTGSPARTYVCATAHTSGTFSTDAAADKWSPLTAAQGATGAMGATGATGPTGPAGTDGVFTTIASQAEAAAGSNNTKGMTPLRVKQAIDALTDTIAADLSLTGDISPTALAANTDDWAPTGFATCSVVRIAASAAYNLTGIAAGTDGRVVVLLNTSAYTITLTHDATSTAANRFYCPNGASYELKTNAAVTIIYDATSSRWRLVSPTVPTNGMIPLSRITSSAAASYTWATASWFSTYRTLKLIGWLQPATDDVELWLRMSDDGGATYEADASDYRYTFVGQEAGAGAARSRLSTGDSKIALGASDATYSVGNASTERIEFEFTFNNLDSSAFFKLVNVVFNYSAAQGDLVRMTGGGRMDAAAAVNGLQLLFESGNIAAGDVTLYGLVNS